MNLDYKQVVQQQLPWPGSLICQTPDQLSQLIKEHLINLENHCISFYNNTIKFYEEREEYQYCQDVLQRRKNLEEKLKNQCNYLEQQQMTGLCEMLFNIVVIGRMMNVSAVVDDLIDFHQDKPMIVLNYSNHCLMICKYGEFELAQDMGRFLIQRVEDMKGELFYHNISKDRKYIYDVYLMCENKERCQVRLTKDDIIALICNYTDSVLEKFQ